MTWSALSTYIYVCKIKGLCYETPALQSDAITPGKLATVDTLSKPDMQEQVLMPGNLIIYFDFDKAKFNSDSSSDKYFDESLKFLDKNPEARLSIIGHTDAIGSDDYNQALGYRRAQRMQRYFADKGLFTNKIIIGSKGEKEPADDNNTKTGRSKNRRAAITIQK